MKEMMQNWRKYAAEMIGTAVLVALGCGTAVFAQLNVAGAGLPVTGFLTSAWVIAVALAFGLSIVAMVYTLGSISGGHFNPAVSLAMAMRKKMGDTHAKNWITFACYVICQVIGAIVGALLLFAVVKLLGRSSVTNMGANSYSTSVLGEAGSVGKRIAVAAIVEVALTFVFVLTVLGVTRRKENKKMAGLIIGLSLVLVHLVGTAITGTSVNPARSIGPAIFAGTTALKEVWVFVLAPLIGGALAAIVACIMFRKDVDDADVEIADVKPAQAAARTDIAPKTTNSK